LLNVFRKRRALAKVVLWILIVMIGLGLLTWFGIGAIPLSPQSPQPPQTQQQQ
jgi:hypothetical protein